MTKNGFKLILRISSRIFHAVYFQFFFSFFFGRCVYKFPFLNKIREIFDPFHICLPQLSNLKIACHFYDLKRSSMCIKRRLRESIWRKILFYGHVIKIY